MHFLLFSIALSLCFFAFRYKRRHMYKLSSTFSPADKSLPLIGVAHKMIGNSEDVMNKLKEYSYAAIEAKGGIVSGWLGHILYFLAVEPVEVEMLLKTCMEKDDLHRFLWPVLGYGGIFAPCYIWRRRRKVIVQAFSPKIVESFVEVFAEQSEILAKRLAERARAGPDEFSVWPYVSTYTLDAVSQTAMGVKVNAQSNPNTPFLLSITAVLALCCERIFHLWLQPDWLYRLFPQYTALTTHVKQMHGFTNEIIRRKREELKMKMHDQPKVDSALYSSSDYKITTFLEHLIHLSGKENGYNDIELREEVLTLTIAGTDTSAVAIGNTLKMLAKYPHVQQRAYEEINSVFGDSDRPLDSKDLQQLKYLERVVNPFSAKMKPEYSIEYRGAKWVKETLRLFPPVPFIIRKVIDNTRLPSGRVLPAGSGMIISIWGLHRNPAHWGPDAESFDPDRFLPERLNLKHACSFMPFSQGPRNCVGYQYALMSIKTALTAILRKCVVVSDPEKSDVPYIRVKLDIMMKDVDGYKIGLKLRKTDISNEVPGA